MCEHLVDLICKRAHHLQLTTLAAVQLKLVWKHASSKWLPVGSKYVALLVLKGIQQGKHLESDHIQKHTCRNRYRDMSKTTTRPLQVSLYSTKVAFTA